MKKIFVVCLAIAAALNSVSAEPAGPRTTDTQFFDALNLDYPGLEAVRTDVGKGNLEAARHDFVSYIKTRTNVKWLFDWRSYDSPQARKLKYSSDVDKYAQNNLVSCTVWHQFGDRVDWSANPTPLKYNEWTWQLSRHPFWAEMGRAYWATGDEKYARAFVNQMSSWVEDNPCPEKVDNGAGSRWRTIESGIRTSWNWPEAFFYFLHSPNFDDNAVMLMLKSFYEHGQYLRKFHRKNNWLTMEMDGLFHVGILFPEFKEAKDWCDYASGKLYEEEKIQFYPDGAQKELAPGYHFVSVKNMMKIVTIARLNGYQLPGDFIDRLEKTYEYALNIMSPAGIMPGVNDSDFQSARKTLGNAYELFPERKDFLFAATAGGKGTEPAFKSNWMPWAGWYAMRSGWNPKEDIYSFFEVGPYSEGHSHEDKLSFVVEAYGDRVITEGSTYPYDKSQWRKYVLSARAHNVSRVDGLDQSRGSYDAKKSTKIRTSFVELPNRFVNTPECVFGEGWYNEGFGHDTVKTVSQYRAMAMINSNYWVVLDVFTPTDNEVHSYDSFFHFNTPEYSVMKKFVGVESADPDHANVAVIRLDSKCTGLDVICGQETPEVQGWIPHGKHDKDYYKCHPVATPIFSRKAAGQVVEPYLILPIRKGESVTLKKIKAVGPCEYAISFSNGKTDRILFSIENGSLKTFSVNGRNVL